MRYYRVRRNRRLLEEQKRENYNIIKGKAITEDKILVFNLYVYHIPKSITKEQILDYFKKYGEIKNVRLIKDQKPKNVQNTSRIAFVNFLEATSATKRLWQQSKDNKLEEDRKLACVIPNVAFTKDSKLEEDRKLACVIPNVAFTIVLANKSHFINDKRIQVRACDSWHQPGAKENAYCSATTTSTGINNTNNASCLQEEALILKLNDDCLEMIVNFLPIVDQINFGQTCRFNGVFIMHSKTKYKKLKLRILEKLTLWQTRRFLQMAGPQIHILEDTYWEPNTRVIESLGLFCKNVETIDISDIELKPALLRKLLKNMKNVNKLILNRAGLSDLCIPVFKNLPKLKHLSLDDNSKLTGKYLKQFVTLEYLSFSNCENVSPYYFKTICECLTELRTLKSNGCAFIPEPNSNELFKHLKNLETLSIDYNNHRWDYIAQLPKLKHLLVDSFKGSKQAILFEE